MEKEPVLSKEKSELDAIDKANERLYADQNDLDGRVMAGSAELDKKQDAMEQVDQSTMLGKIKHTIMSFERIDHPVQQASDNLNAAKAFNKHHGAELEMIAKPEMDEALMSPVEKENARLYAKQNELDSEAEKDEHARKLIKEELALTNKDDPNPDKGIYKYITLKGYVDQLDQRKNIRTSHANFVKDEFLKPNSSELEDVARKEMESQIDSQNKSA